MPKNYGYEDFYDTPAVNLNNLFDTLRTDAPNIYKQLMQKSMQTPLFTKGAPGDAIFEAYNRGYDMHLLQDAYDNLVQQNPQLANPVIPEYDATYFANYDLLKHINESDMGPTLPESINTNFANGYLDTGDFPSDAIAYDPNMMSAPAYDSAQVFKNRLATNNPIADRLLNMLMKNGSIK